MAQNIPVRTKWTPPPARVEGDRLLRARASELRVRDAAVQTEAQKERTKEILGQELGTKVEKLEDTVDRLIDNLPRIIPNGGGGGRKTVKYVLERDYPGIASTSLNPTVETREHMVRYDFSDCKAIIINRWSDDSTFHPALYRKVASDPGNFTAIQDRKGNWFELDPSEVPHVDALGATDSTNTAVQTTTAIQNAIDLASDRGNGQVLFSARTYLIGQGGPVGASFYGLILRSGVVITGPGLHSGCEIKAAPSTNMQTIISDPAGANGIGIRGMKVNYDSVNNPSATVFGRCVEFRDADGIILEDYKGVDSPAYNTVFWSCTKVRIHNIICRNENTSPKAGNAISIIDCSDVIGDKIEAYSVGDDAFGIGVFEGNCNDIHITNLIASAPVVSGGAGARRGIIVDGAGGTMTNISIQGSTRDCGGAGVWISPLLAENVTINVADSGSGFGLYIALASASGIRQCEFNIKSLRAVQQAMTCAFTDGTSFINDCKLNLQAYDPATNGGGAQGAVIRGDRWTGTVNIDYDPLANKSVPSFAIDDYSNGGKWIIHAQGGARNLVVRGDKNSYDIASMADAVTGDILIVAGADDNQFVTGNVTSSVADSGSNNQFSGGKFSKQGVVAAMATDGNGVGTVAHGLIGAPRFYGVQADGDNTYEAIVQSVDATNLYIRVRDTTSNADKASSTQRVIWRAGI